MFLNTDITNQRKQGNEKENKHMKIRKKTLFASLIALGIVGASISVNAANSGYQLSPKFVLDELAVGPTFNLTSSLSVATGANAGVYFKDLGQLESVYSSNSNRKLQFYLVDDDGWAADDLIKQYNGRFEGRTLVSIQLGTVYENGYIDGSTDKTAELFIHGTLGRVSYDIGMPNGTTLFRYNIYLN